MCISYSSVLLILGVIFKGSHGTGTYCYNTSTADGFEVATFCANTYASGPSLILDGNAAYRKDTAKTCSCSATVHIPNNSTATVYVSAYYQFQPNYQGCGSYILIKDSDETQRQACYIAGTLSVRNQELISVDLVKEFSPEDTRYCIMMRISDPVANLTVSCQSHEKPAPPATTPSTSSSPKTTTTSSTSLSTMPSEITQTTEEIVSSPPTIEETIPPSTKNTTPSSTKSSFTDQQSSPTSLSISTESETTEFEISTLFTSAKMSESTTFPQSSSSVQYPVEDYETTTHSSTSMPDIKQTTTDSSTSMPVITDSTTTMPSTIAKTNKTTTYYLTTESDFDMLTSDKKTTVSDISHSSTVHSTLKTTTSGLTTKTVEPSTMSSTEKLTHQPTNQETSKIFQTTEQSTTFSTHQIVTNLPSTGVTQTIISTTNTSSTAAAIPNTSSGLPLTTTSRDTSFDTKSETTTATATTAQLSSVNSSSSQSSTESDTTPKQTTIVPPDIAASKDEDVPVEVIAPVASVGGLLIICLIICIVVGIRRNSCSCTDEIPIANSLVDKVSVDIKNREKDTYVNPLYDDISLTGRSERSDKDSMMQEIPSDDDTDDFRIPSSTEIDGELWTHL